MLLSIFDYFLIKHLQLKYDSFQSDLIWETGFCRCSQGKIRSYWIRVGSYPILVFIQEEENLNTEMQGRRSSDNEEEWKSRNTSQGMPRTVSNYQMLGRRKEGCFLESFRGIHVSANILLLTIEPLEL